MTAPELPPDARDLVEDILAGHELALPWALPAYRNHVLRMTRFCLALEPGLDPVDVAGAGAFHDLGLLAFSTWDYLGPSCELAAAWLERRGWPERYPRIEAMIVNHHKVTSYRGPDSAAVEAFRRADLVDVSLGLVCFGLSRALVRAVRREHPNLGFHRFLVRQSMRGMLSMPWRPLPMFRW